MARQMATLVAYAGDVQESDVVWRVLRRNDRGTLEPFDVSLCEALAKKRGGWARKGSGLAMVANASGLRAIRSYYVNSKRDKSAIYGADSRAYETVCGAMRSFFGYVPGEDLC